MSSTAFPKQAASAVAALLQAWAKLFARPYPIAGERPSPIPLLLLLSALLGGCTAVQSAPAEHRFTGFIETDVIVISPEIGGRILETPVDEGDSVAAGALLARLDDSRIRLQLDLADAKVAQAEAELARLQAAVRPEDIAVAEARTAQAQAALDAAETALDDALVLRDNPQELDVQISQARTALTEAQAQARAAKHQARAADIEAQMWGEIVSELADGRTVILPNGTILTVNSPPEQRHQANVQWNLASQKAWKAWEMAKQADSLATQAQTKLRDLLRQRTNRQNAEAQVVAATNTRDQAAAALAQTQAALAAAKAGPSQEQLAAAEAHVAQARAERNALAAILAKTDITAPADGILLERYFSPGEVIGPGQQLLRLTRPNQLSITIYVPADMISECSVGDILPLVVDSAPEQKFDARIITISDEPEYTTRQSQNNAERAAAVYAVTLQIENPDNLLRPGLPADVLLEGK